MRDTVIAILLVVAGALVVLSALGVLVVRDAYDRLHFTGPAGFAGIPVAAAVIVDTASQITVEKAVLLAVLLVVSSPVGVHVVARATRVADRGSLDLDAEAQR